MEVSALNLIRNTTTIPVPTVRAWGPAASNSLGLLSVKTIFTPALKAPL
jgi:fructosamine-3-kinase